MGLKHKSGLLGLYTCNLKRNEYGRDLIYSKYGIQEMSVYNAFLIHSNNFKFSARKYVSSYYGRKE